MKLQIPGQFRGSDAGRVMPVAIKLRKEYEVQFGALGMDRIKKISPILRIGGELGSFGDDQIEGFKIENLEAECELVIAPRQWKQMSDSEIYDLLKPKILEALEFILLKAGFEALPEFLTSRQKSSR